MAAVLDARSRKLFEDANLAQLATLMRDGSPHIVPVWVGVEGDRLLSYREEGSLGLRNVRRDTRVAVSIADKDNHYRYCTVRGRVVEERGGASAVDWLDQLAISYTGRRYPEPGPAPGVVIVIELDRVRYVELEGFVPGASQ